jgi:hypothetical protein
MALGFLTLWVAILSLPMLTGNWLASPWSDQYSAGYAFRTWGAAEWHRTGHVPLWNPTLLGGIPFLGAMHGDVFYPTSFLRLIWPMPPVMNFGFFLHYILAGLFTYLLLRRLKLSWGASLAGGLAYQLTGLIGSYPSPGHDGKLFGSTAFPLMLLGLVMGMREKKLNGYAILAAGTGCALLGHPQIGYYSLIAAGLFALYLLFDDPERKPAAMLPALAISAGAVLVGIGTTMIQMMPLFAYAPYSLRCKDCSIGFDWVTTFGVPWAHVPEFFFSNFVGNRETYWGPNGLKLHSEYLGLPVVALAIAGVGGVTGRLRAWLIGIGGLFMVVSLASSTPLYQIWWRLVPLAGQIRAPGMAFFVVTLIVAIFAAFGVQRLERGELRLASRVWLICGAVTLLLGLTGVLGSIAQGWATALQASNGQPLADRATAAQTGIQMGALASGLALLALGGLATGYLTGKLKPSVLVCLLALLIGADLYQNDRGFWVYSHGDRELFHLDSLTTRLKALPRPGRVFESGVYPSDLLMAFDIDAQFGQHGNELQAFDQMWGGRNGRYTNQGSPNLLALWGLNYIAIPDQGGAPRDIPGFHAVARGLATTPGTPASLFERDTLMPYARVVTGAVKLPQPEALKILVNSKPFYDQLVLLDAASDLTPVEPTQLPPPSGVKARFDLYEPGHMRIALDPAPASAGYLVVAENYYPDWLAQVDGKPVKVERGNITMITVPVPAGARQVELTIRSLAYERGRLVSIASLSLVLLGLIVPPLRDRSRRV